MGTLREYVLVSTGAKRAEWFTREGEGDWRYRVAEGAGVTLELDGIYRKVELG